jgi:hypothetical protein
MADVLWASIGLWKYFYLVHETLPNLVLAKRGQLVSVLDFACDSQSAMAKHKFSNHVCENVY